MVITGAPNLSNEAEVRGEEKWSSWVDERDGDVWGMSMWSNDWGEWGQNAGESDGAGITKFQQFKTAKPWICGMLRGGDTFLSQVTHVTWDEQIS